MVNIVLGKNIHKAGVMSVLFTNSLNLYPDTLEFLLFLKYAP